MKTRAILLSAGLLALFSVTGCSERTEQAAENTVRSAAQDTKRTAERAGEVTQGAAREAGENLQQAGQAVENTAENAGEAVAGAAQNAQEAVGGVARNAGKEVQDAGQAMSLTPRVKNALVADKSIDASTIDVDTTGEKDTVTLKGTVRSEAEKTRATQIAKKALTDAGSQFKVKNNLTVQK